MVEIKICFGHYNHCVINHVNIKPKTQKIIKIPYYISLKSTNGEYIVTENKLKEIKNFFSLMNPFYIVTGGFDMLTGDKQFIPFFIYYEKYRLPYKTNNVGIFSTLYFFEKISSCKFINKFMGFSLLDYNYLERDIYHDYLFSEDQNIKKYSFVSIKKQCNLYFIINFLVTSNLTENMNEYYYFKKYILLIRTLNNNFIFSLFLDLIIKNSFSYFEKEQDIYKMISYRYAPRYLGVNGNFEDIYKIITPENIKKKILQNGNL